MSRPVRTDWTIVILMALRFGLVGIDRFMMATLYPVAKDLGLDYADIGIITGALAFAWAFAALFIGGMADRTGRRRVLTGRGHCHGRTLGGGLAPVIAGHFTASFGIAHLLWLPIGAIAVSLLLVSGLSETHPRTALIEKEAII